MNLPFPKAENQLTPYEREKLELFLAYLSIKGGKEIRREWMGCRGPWYSISIRNTYGPSALRYFGRKLRKKLGES